METKEDLILEKRVLRPNFLLSEQLAQNIMFIISDRTAARYAMLDQCRHYFHLYKNNLTAVNTFADMYQSKHAAYWYTKDCFIHRIINKVLRQGNLEFCSSLRLYTSDLSVQLCQLKCQQSRDVVHTKQNTILYRGLRQSEAHLQMLRSLVGETILTKGFMSTSRDKHTALFYAAPLHPQSSQSQSLLIEINVDMTAPDIIAADIAYLSDFPDEQEVLFDVGAQFRVESVAYDSLHSTWYCRLVAMSSESRVIPLAQDNSSNGSCVDLSVYSKEEAKLERLMRRERRRKFFPTPNDQEDDFLWSNLPSISWIAISPSDRARIFQQKAMMNWQQNSDVRLLHSQYKQAWELMKQETPDLSSDNHDIACFLNNLGFTCRLFNDTNFAIQLLKKSSEMRNRLGTSKHFRAQSLRNLALAYTDQGNYDDALASLNQALVISQQGQPALQWSTSMILRNFVYFYHKKGDYRRAIEYYFRALETFQQCANP